MGFPRVVGQGQAQSHGDPVRTGESLRGIGAASQHATGDWPLRQGVSGRWGGAVSPYLAPLVFFFTNLRSKLPKENGWKGWEAQW